MRRKIMLIVGHDISWLREFIIVVVMSFHIFRSTSAGERLNQRRMVGLNRNGDEQQISRWNYTKRDEYKQRKLHPYLPTYEIVGFSGPTTRTHDHKDFFASSENKDEATKRTRPNMDQYLAKISKAREKLMRSDLSREIQPATASMKLVKPAKSSKSSLEDDIASVNSLIGMLLKANSALMEERENEKGSNESHTPIRETGKRTATVRDTLAGGDRNQSNRIDSELGHESSRLDHVLVKPGFGNSGDSELVKSANSIHEDMASEAQQISPLSNLDHHRQPLSPAYLPNEDGQFVNTHKPIVAKDLLHVSRNPHHEQHLDRRQPEYLSRLMQSPVRLNGDNPFNHPRSHPSSHHHQPIMIDHKYYSQPPTTEQPPLFGGPYQPHQAADVDERHNHHGYQMTSPAPHKPPPMVPPYNGHPIASMLGWHQPPMGEDPYGRPLPPPPTTMHPLAVGGSQSQSGGDNEVGPPLSPLQHLLMAAKNQEAAAMAYERRRLEHEMELGKRQQDMRKQHEAIIAAKHQQALEQQQQQEEKKKNEKQQDESEPSNEAGGQQEQQQNDDQRHDQANEENGNEEHDNNQQSDAEKSQDNDSDMKGFQEFAGDSDFTDLFPPGILSDAEIREMKKQHQEQKQKEAEEEREKQQQQEQPDESDSDSNSNNSNSESNSISNNNPNSNSNSNSNPEVEQTQENSLLEQQQPNADSAANVDKQLLLQQQQHAAEPEAAPVNQTASADRKSQTSVANFTRPTETPTTNSKKTPQHSTNYLPKFGQITKEENNSSPLTQPVGNDNNSSAPLPLGSSAMQAQQSESIYRRSLSPPPSSLSNGMRKITIRRSHDVDDRHPRARRVPQQPTSLETLRAAAAALTDSELLADLTSKSWRRSAAAMLDQDYHEHYVKPFLSAAGYTAPRSRAPPAPLSLSSFERIGEDVATRRPQFSLAAESASAIDSIVGANN